MRSSWDWLLVELVCCGQYWQTSSWVSFPIKGNSYRGATSLSNKPLSLKGWDCRGQDSGRGWFLMKPPTMDYAQNSAGCPSTSATVSQQQRLTGPFVKQRSIQVTHLGYWPFRMWLPLVMCVAVHRHPGLHRTEWSRTQQLLVTQSVWAIRLTQSRLLPRQVGLLLLMSLPWNQTQLLWQHLLRVPPQARLARHNEATWVRCKKYRQAPFLLQGLSTLWMIRVIRSECFLALRPQWRWDSQQWWRRWQCPPLQQW